jgi:enoyl-CoA hydratase/carnithine racemase
MYRALNAALDVATDDDQIRVVVLRGEGRGFCAGNDLGDFLKPDAVSSESPVLHFLQRLRVFPKVLIAGIHGSAIGIGTTVLLHCDHAIAASDAKFQMPFARLGLVPEAGSSLLIPDMVGHRRAFEWLVLGEPFNAQAAEQHGFVNAVVPVEELDERVDTTARRYAALPPGAVRQAKALMRGQHDDALRAAMDDEIRSFSERLAGPEVREAVNAFFEKRPADFSRFT